MGSRTVKVVGIVLAVVLRASLAAGQATELRGTVIDETGGVLVGARVTLDDSRDAAVETVTDGEGRFQFEGLEGETASVGVTLEGFAPLNLNVDLTPPIDPLVMTMGILIEESVEVNDVIPGLSAELNRNLSSFLLSGDALAALPRDQNGLMRRLAEMAGFTGRPEMMAVYVDGFARTFRLPPFESIQLIRVAANAFDARYAEPGQQRIEIVTKPGSSQVVGEFSAGFTDESLNARSPFEAEKPPQQNRNLSGYVGGPIVPDRWSVLVYAGRWEEDENDSVFAVALDPESLDPIRVTETVPTPSRTNNVSFKLDSIAGEGRQFSGTYDRNKSSSENLGLSGGLDLPERSYDRTSTDDGVRLLLSSFGNDTVNEVRLDLSRTVSAAQATLGQPAVFVLDSFNGGGNQDSLLQRDTLLDIDISDDYTLGLGAHTLEMGGRFRRLEQQSEDRSNFGGTFLFGTDAERDENGEVIVDQSGDSLAISSLERYQRTLLGVVGYRPSQFTINQGSPLVEVGQWSTGWYFQDDWRLSNRLTLSLGLRHDYQSDVADRLNLGPRMALAWLADAEEKSAIRLGWGLFHTPVGLDLEFTQIKLDADHQRQLIVTDPPFFEDIPTTLAGDLRLPTVSYVKAPDLRVPYSVDASVSYERELSEAWFGAVTYRWQGGHDLLRLRNINAPVDGDGGTRADPDRGPILQFESTGRSSRHELQTSFRGDFGDISSLYFNYTLGRARNDTDGPFSSPASSFDLLAERGPAADDLRHQFVVGGSATLPGGLSLSPHVTLASPVPFNITTGLDNNGDTLFTDRPALASPGDPNAISTPFGLLTPFPRPGDELIPRNLGREEWIPDVNLSVVKSFTIKGGQVQFVTNVQNLLNATRSTGYAGTLISPTFGRASSGLGGRRISLTLQYSF